MVITRTSIEAPVLSEFETDDPDLARDFLAAAYGTGVRISRDGPAQYRLRHRRVDAGAFCVESVAQSGRLNLLVEPLHAYIVSQTVTARLERTCDGVGSRYVPGDVFLLNQPHLPYAVRRLPGRSSATILDPALLDQVADSGPERRAWPIRFTGLDPISPAGAAYWRSTCAYVTELLANPVATALPLPVGAAARLLAAAALTIFPNTALAEPTIEDRHDAHPATLRRAIAFIDAHPDDDISPADIAAAAGVTIRAVQLSFRRHLGTTPMAYLRQVRLACAHRDLQAADPSRGDTVLGIAVRWGFTHPGRFTALYRSAYQVTPGTTLRR
ncbi:helix-turn-helix transcriptional regulator [Nonomuraea sp. NPDC050643]|uniref:helix-turn-helix transcriptional regulator n=1 Tax=Nonomuraea sp. NPDC050643 TaxID=3155660 RepID=UPI0033F18589